MSSKGNQFRAVSLAALMVLSVVAVSAAVSPAAATTIDGGNATAPGSTGVSVNDALVNVSDGTPHNIDIGYNTNGTSNPSVNVSVDGPDGDAWFNESVSSGNSGNLTVDLASPETGSSLTLENGETYDITANLDNQSDGSFENNASAKVFTFGLNADNTSDGKVASNRNVEVADLNFSASPVDNVSVDLNASGDIEPNEVQSITVTEQNASGTELAETTVPYDAHDKTVELEDSQNTSQIQVTALTSSSLTDGSTINADVTFNINPSTTVNTAGTQTATTGVNSATITGDVRTSDNDIVDNATVSVFNDDTNTFVTNLTTDSTGTYSGNLGGDANYTVDVVSAPGFNLDNFDQRDTSEPLLIQSGDSGRIDIRLDEVLQPNDLQVTNLNPADTTQPADNSSTITVELTVFDQDGNGLGGEDVNIDTGSSTIFVQESSPQTTGSDGTVEFTIFSNETQTGTLDFDVSGTSLTATQDVEFVPTFLDAEDGIITGTVGNVDQSNEEDATVYAVREGRTANNEFEVEVNLSSYSDDSASFRIQDTSSGDLIDSDRYDVTFSDTGAESNFTLNSDVRPLNSDDSAAGNGFQVLNDSSGSSSVVNATVLIVEPGNYTIQDASGTSPTDSDFTDRAVVEPSADLTLADAENRAANSDQNLVDTTDEDGDFRLTQLNTNGDNGRDYLVIVQKAGLSTEFDGTGTVDPDSIASQGDIVLQPRDAPPVDAVNITNIGLAQTDGGEAEVFENQTDDFAQEIPRDGTYDVIKVETFVDSTEAAGNGTVTLEVLDDSNEEDNFDTLPNRVFNGEFSSTVDNGTFISTGEDNITIATGDDGVARVYLETDNSNVDLNESDFNDGTTRTGITATLSGTTDTDFTNKSFVGVTEFTTGSISGLVTDENNQPLEGANLFVSGIDTDEDGTDEFTIERNVNETSGEATFEVTRQATGVSENVTGSELSDYNFGAFSDVGATKPVTLFTEDVSSSYTLSDVPADDDGVALTISGVANDVLGTSVPGTVTTGSTGSANVQIDTELTPNFEVSNVAPDGASVEEGTDITVTAEIENTGSADGTQDIEFRLDTNGNGTLESSETLATNDSFSVDAGETRTVTFADVSTDGLSNDTFTHGVFSDDSDATATLTVNAADDDQSDLSRFDADGNGQIGSGEVLDVITAYNEGGTIGGEEVSAPDVLDIITAYNEDTQI